MVRVELLIDVRAEFLREVVRLTRPAGCRINSRISSVSRQSSQSATDGRFARMHGNGVGFKSGSFGNGLRDVKQGAGDASEPVSASLARRDDQPSSPDRARQVVALVTVWPLASAR